VVQFLLHNRDAIQERAIVAFKIAQNDRISRSMNYAVTAGHGRISNP
jgi:hypothetical protein